MANIVVDVHGASLIFNYMLFVVCSLVSKVMLVRGGFRGGMVGNGGLVANIVVTGRVTGTTAGVCEGFSFVFDVGTVFIFVHWGWC